MGAAKKGLSRLGILGVLLLFVAPILVSWALVSSGWRPGGATNHGVLLEPPIPVAEAGLTRDGAAVGERPFTGYWTVLVALPEACDDACMASLSRLGRVHLALNKDMDRVRFALLLPPKAEIPDLPAAPTVFRAAPDAFRRLVGAGGIDVAGLSAHVVDPQGWIILAYPHPVDADGLLKDLRRLLRASDEERERFQRYEEDL